METNHNQTVLITGASSGIGLELAKLFAKDHYKLIIVSRDENQLTHVAHELRNLGATDVMVIAKDLSQANAAEELFQETRERNIEVDILVNDAGIGQRGLFYEIDFSRDLEIINLNIISVVHLTKLYLHGMMMRKRGKILQLASIASLQPTPFLAVYAASKAFILSFTDAIINELKDTGITITALLPGPTDTDFFNKAEAEDTKAFQDNPDDPSVVAKRGYEALMKGEHRAYGSAKMQAMAGMSAVLPNEAVTSMAKKYMEEE